MTKMSREDVRLIRQNKGPRPGGLRFVCFTLYGMKVCGLARLEVSSGLIEGFGDFFIYLISALIPWCWETLMKIQWLSGRESGTSAKVTFCSPKQLTEMISFSTWAQQWSQKRRQLQSSFINTDREVSHDFMQDVFFFGDKCIISPIAAKVVLRMEMLSASISWTLFFFGRGKLHMLGVPAQSLPVFFIHSNWSPTGSEITLGATLGCKDTFGFLPPAPWPPCRQSAARVGLYVC